MFVFLFVCSLFVPISMIALGAKWRKTPPRDRYGHSGYRTAMSRLNDDTWKYAHRYWGRINFVLGITLTVITIAILILKKEYPDFEMLVTYLVFIQMGIMALTIIPTEIVLHKHFTPQGIKKNNWHK